ncbi:LysR family transcriptional regulator [Thioclava sp. BHET1]|nr:LysR family transcriptional regulator [Thioclava sp. BHET1]
MSDLNLIPVLVAIFETRSVSRTAELLNQSQPTVSRALSRLRVILDDPLFVRSRQGMIPTEMCRQIVGDVRPAIRKIETAMQQADHFDPTQSRRTFRIAVSDLGEMTYVHRVMPHFRQQAPFAKIEIHALDVEKIEEWLAVGRVDAALGNLTLEAKSTRSDRLFQEHYVAIASTAHREIGTALNRAAYFAGSHILVSERSGHWQGPDFCSETETKRHVVMRIPHFFGLGEIVAKSDLISIVPSRVAREFTANHAIRSFPLPFDSPRFDVRLISGETRQRRPDIDWLRSLISAALRDLVPGSPRASDSC